VIRNKEEEGGEEEEEEEIKEDNNSKKLTKEVNIFTFRFTCVTQYIGNDSFIGDMTHSNEASHIYNTLGMHVLVLYISSIHPFIHLCSYVTLVDLFVYGVAKIRGLLKIIGLFCRT